MRLLSLGMPRVALWPAFALIVVVSVLLGGVGDMLAPAPEGVLISYFGMTALLGLVFLAYALAVWKIGSAMGGKGSLQESILIGVFFQAVLIPAQILQLVLALLLPGLAGIYAVALLVYGIWMNTNFIDGLHGYASFGKSLGVLVLASFAAAIALMLVVAIFGFSVGVPF